MKSPAHVARTVWKHGSWAAAELARRGRPRHLVFFCGDTLGDDLMCTAVLRELRERGERGVWKAAATSRAAATARSGDRAGTGMAGMGLAD